MLLFKKKDLLVVISKSGTTVQFTKSLKDILKYQYRYNYKFKMYEDGKVTTADDYIIEGETLTVLFGSATVTYTSEGASYTEGESGGGGGTLYGPYLATNVSTVEFGTNTTITFGVASVFQNRLRITDINGNFIGWVDEAKCLLSGIDIPSSTTVINVGTIYTDPPVITVRKLVDTVTSVSAETITIQFYTDVELFELA